MRIAVSTFGSEGDVRPFIALTRRLRAAGEDAFLLSNGVHRARAEEFGVPFVASETRWGASSRTEDLEKLMREKNPLRQTQIISQALTPAMVDAVAGALEALPGADLVVHHQFDMPGYAAALKLGLPRVNVGLFHSDLINENRLATGQNLGRPLNRAMSRLIRWTFNAATQRAFAPVFAAAGVAQPRRAYSTSADTARKTLLAISPAFLPADPAWGDHVVQTGYWFLDAAQFTPPEGLRQFVEGGEPPVVITFGSMVGSDTAAHTRELLAGLERSGRRAVLQAGWAELASGVTLPQNVLRVGHVPHDWLFPRAACVVHHGGAGTTGACLRAGVPQLVVFHMGDQVMWGNLARRAGVSPVKPRWHGKLTAAWLAHAIERARDPHVVATARALGEKVRAEDGTGRAVEAIRAIAGGLRTGAAA